MVRSSDSNTDFFDIVAGVLQRDTLETYLFIIYLDYILRMSIDLMKENGLILKKVIRLYHTETVMDEDNADDLMLFANTPAQANCLVHSWNRQRVPFTQT